MRRYSEQAQEYQAAAGQSSLPVADAGDGARLLSPVPAAVSRHLSQTFVAETPFTDTLVGGITHAGISAKRALSSGQEPSSFSSHAEFLQSPQFRKAFDQFANSDDSRGSANDGDDDDDEGLGGAITISCNNSSSSQLGRRRRTSLHCSYYKRSTIVS